MFIVSGENVYPSAIEDVIRGIKGTGDEYRIHGSIYRTYRSTIQVPNYRVSVKANLKVPPIVQYRPPYFKFD